MTTAIPVAPQSARPAPRKRPPPRLVEVRRVARLTPRMTRLTLGGEQMAGFQSPGAAAHIRVFLPDADSGELVLPLPGPDGAAFPEDKPRPASRAYTPRHWRPDDMELDVDFALHDHGPGATWAANAREGCLAVISGHAGGAYAPDPTADWHLIAGDESALPAVGTLLEELPSSASAYVFVEVYNADEEQELTSPADLHIRWLHRREGKTPGHALHRREGETPGRALAAAMRDVELPKGDGRIWAACEASAMREIRRFFIEERGVARSMLRTQGYWKAGEANHPDHDMGEDV